MSKTTLFQVETELGTFWIRPEPDGRVQLGLDGHKLRTYKSATEAARAVAKKATGWELWDSAEAVIAPPTLYKWKRGS
jgi:hypothetical protein